MKQKWIIILFAAVFAISVAVGLGVRANLNSDRQAYASSPESSASEPTLPPPQSENVPDETLPPEPAISEPPSEPEPESVFPEQVAQPEPLGTVRICVGGDTSIDAEFADFAKLKGVDYPWLEISELMNAADISVVNLETCVSERGVSEKKEGYGFRTPPEMLDGFKNAGIDAVNLANNHVRDFGYDALLDTFSNLDDRDISYFGSGKNADEAAGLKIFEVNGVKVGFTGANRVYLTADCAASADRAGVNMIGDVGSDSALLYIEKLREYDALCDVLIVFLHAGTEEVFDVTSYQKDMARAFIDAGADIVVGGHSHTLQPIEFYNGKPIIYSIGNLIFWHIDDDIDGLTAVFDITVDKNGFAGLRLHPLFIKNYKVYYLSDGDGNYPDRYRQIIKLMNDLCEPYDVWFDGEGNLLRGIPEEILEARRAQREQEAQTESAE